MSDAKNMTGRVALVTGAGKRLGRAVALRLAEEGADVAVHYHDSARDAAEVVGLIEELGQRAVAIRADLRSVDEIRKLFLETGNELGRLDLLVNSAANFLPGSVISTTEEIWDASLDTNVKAPFFCAQAAAPMLRRSKGSIVNFADTGGLLGWQGFVKLAPLRKTGKPSDIADAVIYLAAAEFLTGHTLVVDGGRMA